MFGSKMYEIIIIMYVHCREKNSKTWKALAAVNKTYIGNCLITCTHNCKVLLCVKIQGLTVRIRD